MPRAGSTVIHPQMLQRARVVAEGAQVGSCSIRLPGTGVGAFDSASGTYPTVPGDVLYAGPCRVQPRADADPREVEAAGEGITLSRYQVSLPITAPAIPLDAVVTLSGTADPQLAGRTLRVTEVLVGDLQLERHLVCETEQDGALSG